MKSAVNYELIRAATTQLPSFTAREECGASVAKPSDFLKESGSQDRFVNCLDFYTLAINSN